MLTHENPEEIIDAALSLLSSGSDVRAALDELAVPVYLTDSTGSVTYWNQACVNFAGREPKLGHDRWCVTWQLYTVTGEPLEHADCPMAEAIKQKRAVRNTIAIAERPDGSRVAFRPYPTPIMDDDGSLRGAINVMIDVSEEQGSALREQAERCRRLAAATYDRTTSDVLDTMADSFNRTADDLTRRA